MKNEEVRKEARKWYNYGKMAGVACDIIDRLPSEGDITYDDIFQAIDEGLIYTEDQWTVIEWYCTPYENRSINDVICDFCDELLSILQSCNIAVELA